MKIIERKPIPIYEIICYECQSKIRYKACEVSWNHITCPVCGISLWANTFAPKDYEQPKEGDSE